MDAETETDFELVREHCIAARKALGADGSILIVLTKPKGVMIQASARDDMGVSGRRFALSVMLALCSTELKEDGMDVIVRDADGIEHLIGDEL